MPDAVQSFAGLFWSGPMPAGWLEVPDLLGDTVRHPAGCSWCESIHHGRDECPERCDEVRP